MARHRIVWRSGSRPFTAHRLTFAGEAAPFGGIELPYAAEPLAAHDEAVFLLHTAAEVEHSLLVQYLYAAFSVNLEVPDGPSWQNTLLTIAIEEMGHLITVQNILRAIGGALNWDREDYPFRSEFYPFPFALEPLSRDSVAKYVAAEMPESPPESQYPLLPEILARLQTDSDVINRVGRLYLRLIDLFERELTEDHFDPDTTDYQPDPGQWLGADPTAGPHDPRAVVVVPIEGNSIEMRRKTIDALRLIAEQGEGTQTQVRDSHFALFYGLYSALPETNERFGAVTTHAALPVPVNPQTVNASPDPLDEGRITEPTAVAWAQFFNLRYRMLLTTLHHALVTNRREYPDDERFLRSTAFSVMRELRQFSQILTTLPRQRPNLYLGGRYAVAGAPFELPYSLQMPDRATDRWRLQCDLLLNARDQADILRQNPPSSAADQLLQAVARQDTVRLAEVQRRLPPPPTSPRLHFRGQFLTNVCTTNNGLPGLDTVEMQVDTNGMTDDEFRTWLLQTSSGSNGIPRLHGGWNPLGANDFAFQDVVITAVEWADGTLITDPAVDPLIGQPVLFNGIMVDLDPENVVDTQIFPDRLQLQAGAGQLRGRPTVLHSRGLSFRRNVSLRGSRAAGTLFQSVLRADAWTVRGQTSSPTLSDLIATGGSGGISIHFSTYLAAPQKSDAELATLFAAGETPVNPSIGTVVGTISPWHGSALASVPSGRRLDPVREQPEPPGAVAPAFVSLARQRGEIQILMLHTVPEKDASGAKVELGSLRLQLQTPTSTHDLGALPYEESSYRITSGLVTLPLTPEVQRLWTEGVLRIVQAETGMVLLHEKEWVFETDQRSVYLEEGESTSLSVQVAYRGGLPPEASSFRVTEFDRAQDEEGLFPPTENSAKLISVPSQVSFDTSGWARVPVQAVKPGVARLGFSLVGEDIGRLNGTLGCYANLRVLPQDDYSVLTDEQLTFSRIYEEVLRYYHLLYPAMTLIFDLSDEEQVIANAQVILDRIDTSQSAPEYMPRTRELSKGKRALLSRWCRRVLADPTVAPVPIPLSEAIEQMHQLIAFLKSPPHLAANRHAGVELPSGQTLSDLFANPDVLLEYLRTGFGINRETGNPLIVPHDPMGSAFYRMVTGGVASMANRFALDVPGLEKSGVTIVEQWILALSETIS